MIFGTDPAFALLAAFLLALGWIPAFLALRHPAPRHQR